MFRRRGWGFVLCATCAALLAAAALAAVLTLRAGGAASAALEFTTRRLIDRVAAEAAEHLIVPDAGAAFGAAFGAVAGAAPAAAACPPPPDPRRAADSTAWGETGTGSEPASAAARAAYWWSYPQAPSLPREQLQSGIQYRGDDRLLEVASKLLRGAPVSIGVIGGSVSAGMGAVGRDRAWGALVAASLRARFPNSPIEFFNGAVGASGASFFETCFHWVTPAKPDLVLIELAVNEPAPKSAGDFPLPELRPLERLLRRVLAAGSAAAVVNFHSWRGYQAWGAFTATAGDQFCMLAQYYGQACISFRNALIHHMVDPAAAGPREARVPFLRRPGNGSAPLGPDGAPVPESVQVLSDRHHPNPLGHRMLADLVLALISQAVFEAQVRPAAPPAPPGAAAPAAAPAGPESGPPATAASVGALGGPRLLPLPPPMFPHNEPATVAQCRFGETLSSIVTKAEGFRLVTEGTAASPKPGYVGEQPGAVLELTFPTTVAKTGPGKQAPERVDVALGVLISHEHMGWARVECASGCACDAQELNGNHSAPTSVRRLFHFSVTTADACVMRVTVLRKADTPGKHKFKVNALLVSEGQLKAVDVADEGTSPSGQGRQPDGRLKEGVKEGAEAGAA